jgi:hypothetical protein
LAIADVAFLVEAAVAEVRNALDRWRASVLRNLSIAREEIP